LHISLRHYLVGIRFSEFYLSRFLLVKWNVVQTSVYLDNWYCCPNFCSIRRVCHFNEQYASKLTLDLTPRWITMKQRVHILIFLISFSLSHSASATINAWLNQSQIDKGETVQLTLQHEGQTDSQPDLNPLQKDFDIVGQSGGSNIQITNGKINAQIELYITLMPKHTGKLQIPALQWDGQSSTTLTLVVGSNDAGDQTRRESSKISEHFFITSTLGQKQPFIQAAVPLVVRIYSDQPLYQASLEFPSNHDVVIQQIDLGRQTNETRNDKNYQVIERKFLLIPQRSGNIHIDAPVLVAQIQAKNHDEQFGNNSMFSNIFGLNPFGGILQATRPIKIKGNSAELIVRPRPANAKGNAWLPAIQMSLEGTWLPDHELIHAGDHIILHLHLSADGLAATQLPDMVPHMQLPSGLHFYPDQPRLNTNLRENIVNGTWDQTITFIADKAGIYKIPEIQLFWWDIDKNVEREMHLPARTLEVLPSGKGISI